jgi:poly(3-hydroxybutyrate) depolymerase
MRNFSLILLLLNLLFMVNCVQAQNSVPELPELNIDLKQTTVSGVSSGGFMAVQMGVAKSSFIKGVAATAGGPYLCVLEESYNYFNVIKKSIPRCMQGDPAYSVQPISAERLDKMEAATRDWARKGKIDSVDNLKNQAVWIFHGYNDGVVKLAVSQALVDWYSRFTPATQIFHKDTLPAAHALISAACDSTSNIVEASCNPCSITGNKYINACSESGKHLRCSRGSTTNVLREA